MKLTVLGLFFFASLAQAATPETLSQELHSPLIVGASQSADKGSMSAGKKLTLRYDAQAPLVNFAMPGRPGAEVLATMPAANFEGRSSLIGLDLFFWDSALSDTDASVAALHGFIARAQAQNIPVVLGDIPMLLPGHQPGLVAMNEALVRECAAYAKCAVFSYSEIFQVLLKQGYLEMGGRKYTWKEIAPDGLHFADFANEYLADRLGEGLMKHWP